MDKDEIVRLARLMQAGEMARQKGRVNFAKHDFDTIVKIGQTRLDAAEYLLENGYGNLKEAKEGAEYIKRHLEHNLSSIELRTEDIKKECGYMTELLGAFMAAIDKLYGVNEAEEPSSAQELDGAKIGLYEGIITIICDDATENKTPRVKKLYPSALGSPYDKAVTLNDCLKIIEFDGEGMVTVIFEEPLHGKIYQYGNYGKYWVKHGTTVGYA